MPRRSPREWIVRPPGWLPLAALAAVTLLAWWQGQAAAVNDDAPVLGGVRNALDGLGLAYAVGAPLLLAALTARESPRRRRVAWVLALVAAFALIHGIVPQLWATTDAVRNERFGTAMPPPVSWTWPERMQALSSGTTPEGQPLNALTARAIVDEIAKALLLVATFAIVLTPALRPRTKPVHPAAATLAAFTPVILVPLSARAFEAGSLGPRELFACFLFLPLAAFALSVHAWFSDGRARRTWAVAAASCVMACAVALAAPRLLGSLDGKAARIGAPAPSITVLRADGTRLGVEHEGKVTVLTYWASWCGPCRAELELLDGMRRAEARLLVVPVNNGEDPRTAQAAWDQLGLSGEPYLPTAELIEGYPFASLPSSCVIDSHGVVRSIRLGFSKEEMEREIRDLLAR